MRSSIGKIPENEFAYQLKILFNWKRIRLSYANPGSCKNSRFYVSFSLNTIVDGLFIQILGHQLFFRIKSEQ